MPFSSYIIDLNGSTQEITTNSFETNLTTGVYDFKVKAKDAVGQESPFSNTVKVYIDTTPPAAPNVTSPTHPLENETYNIRTPLFNLTTAFDDSGTGGYYYIIDDSTNTTPNEFMFFAPNNTINITGFFSGVQSNETTPQEGLPDGTWYFHVVAVDNVTFGAAGGVVSM